MSFLPPNLGFKCLFLPFTTEYISKSSLQHSYHISPTGTLTYCKYKRQVKWEGNISQSYSSRFILSKKHSTRQISLLSIFTLILLYLNYIYEHKTIANHTNILPTCNQGYIIYCCKQIKDN